MFLTTSQGKSGKCQGILIYVLGMSPIIAVACQMPHLG